MPTNYFANFQSVPYRFGDNETAVFTKKLSQYVSVLEHTKNSETLYEKYTIMAGERPDTLSYKLYGTVDYYWTFFLVNEHIRESGWAIPSYDLLEESKVRYPHRTVTTNGDISSDNGSYELFPVGATVTGQQSGTQGTIIRKIPEMGQIIINTGGSAFLPTEQLSFSTVDGNKVVNLISESAQYDSVHHYEDADGVHQDLPLFDFGNPAQGLTPISYRERLENKNLELQRIVIIKPSSIGPVVREFKSLMKQRL